MHEKVINSPKLCCAFGATGTWLPIAHLVHNENGNFALSIPSEENDQISLQHLNQYIYSLEVTREAI
jgi:hypothetical protein